MVGPDLLFLDCDGVILESADIKKHAFGELFADRPEHIAAIVELHAQASGISRYIQFEMVYADILGLPLTEEVSADLGRRYSELVLASLLGCPIVPGVVDTLQRWAGKVPIVVVSGSPQEELVDVLERRGLAHYFDQMVGTPTEKPAAIRRALRHWKIMPTRAVLVGDAPSDWKAAAETHINFVGRTASGGVPFPPGTVTVVDLTELERAFRELAIPD